MMNQSRQSRCARVGGYAGIMGYDRAYPSCGGRPRPPCAACASDMSISWAVSPFDSRKLIRCEIGELCTLGSSRNVTALCIMSARGSIAGTTGADDSGMLGRALWGATAGAAISSRA